ncbi:MAG TPA: DUF6292 family protein [Pseudonocardiaceae bacterium]
MTAIWDRSGDNLTGIDDDGVHRVATDEVDLMLVERGLRAYVHRVATGLGLDAAATYCEAAERISAYIALDDRLPGWADQDAALVWDAEYGWAVSVETHPGEDLLILAYHGVPLVPRPAVVIAFATATLANPPSVPETVSLARPGTADQLCEQFLAYLPSRQ